MDTFDFNRFVKDNINADTVKLRLKYAGNKEVVDAIEQIELRRKAGDKFQSGDLDLTPARLYGTVSVEQSTSASIAVFHARLASNVKRVLDMTMGIGIDAAAFALVDGAEVTAIEKNPELAALSIENYKGVSGIKVICDDSSTWIKCCREQFDLVFVDPARRADDGSRVYNVHDCKPDITVLSEDIFRCAPRCMATLSPMLDISATLKELPATKSIYIVEEKGECREILADMESKFDGEPSIVAINGDRVFSFTASEESQAQAEYATPESGEILYEPWPSVMKAAPYRLLSSRYECKALSANTHLYFSKDIVEDFPGKAYRIEAVLPYQSGVLKRFARQYGDASVSVRNFGDTAEKVRAKLKVKENSQRRVIATTAANGDRLLILVARIQ